MNNELHLLREKWEASVSALEVKARAVSGGSFHRGEICRLNDELGSLRLELAAVKKERDEARFACAELTAGLNKREQVVRLQARDLEQNKLDLETMRASAQELAAQKARADSIAEELRYARAENESLRRGAESSGNAAAQAQHEVLAREQFIEDTLKRLNRAETECERISQNFIHYRMEVLTQRHREAHRRKHSEPVLGEKLLAWIAGSSGGATK